LAWNSGDLEEFMSAYYHSDSLLFIGRSGMKYGWQTTLDNYRRGYPDREAMGRLQFENLDVRKLSDDHAFVAGAWTLYRTDDTLAGFYSLIWRYLDGRWVIIADHSS
jgi:hypothetical protein